MSKHYSITSSPNSIEEKIAANKIKPIFVGNIDTSVKPEEITRLFENIGKTVLKTDLKTGFAFVFLEEHTDDVVRKLDGTLLGHRKLKVEIARGDGIIKSREDERRKTAQTVPSRTLFVVNFAPHETNERDLRRAFARYGNVLRVDMRRNYAFIEFEKIEQATDALKGMNGEKLLDREIIVEYMAGNGAVTRKRSRSRSRSRSPSARFRASSSRYSPPPRHYRFGAPTGYPPPAYPPPAYYDRYYDDPRYSSSRYDRYYDPHHHHGAPSTTSGRYHHDSRYEDYYRPTRSYERDRSPRSPNGGGGGGTGGRSPRSSPTRRSSSSRR